MNIYNTLSFTDFILYLLFIVKTVAKVLMFCEVYLHSAQKYDFHVRKEFNIILILHLKTQ